MQFESHDGGLLLEDIKKVGVANDGAAVDARDGANRGTRRGIQQLGAFVPFFLGIEMKIAFGQYAGTKLRADARSVEEILLEPAGRERFDLIKQA